MFKFYLLDVTEKIKYLLGKNTNLKQQVTTPANIFFIKKLYGKGIFLHFSLIFLMISIRPDLTGIAGLASLVINNSKCSHSQVNYKATLPIMG